MVWGPYMAPCLVRPHHLWCDRARSSLAGSPGKNGRQEINLQALNIHIKHDRDFILLVIMTLDEALDLAI